MPETPDITDPDKLDAVQGGKGPNTPTYEPDSDAFKQHMDGEKNPLQQTKAPSPMDVAGQVNKTPSTPPTMDSVREQMNSVSSSLGDLKTNLHTKGLKLKNSEKYLMRSKLGKANEHINTAARKLGVPQSASEDSTLNRSKNPIKRFLSMVSDGQRQMVDAADTIKNLNATGKSVNPGDLLLVQIKLNKAQQELNYTSVILGNATSMIKTLFNIQI